MTNTNKDLYSNPDITHAEPIHTVHSSYVEPQPPVTKAETIGKAEFLSAAVAVINTINKLIPNELKPPTEYLKTEKERRRPPKPTKIFFYTHDDWRRFIQSTNPELEGIDILELAHNTQGMCLHPTPIIGIKEQNPKEVRVPPKDHYSYVIAHELGHTLPPMYKVNNHTELQSILHINKDHLKQALEPFSKEQLQTIQTNGRIILIGTPPKTIFTPRDNYLSEIIADTYALFILSHMHKTERQLRLYYNFASMNNLDTPSAAKDFGGYEKLIDALIDTQRIIDNNGPIYTRKQLQILGVLFMNKMIIDITLEKATLLGISRSIDTTSQQKKLDPKLFNNYFHTVLKYYQELKSIKLNKIYDLGDKIYQDIINTVEDGQTTIEAIQSIYEKLLNLDEKDTLVLSYCFIYKWLKQMKLI